jgi:hypothetical protein
MAANTFPQIHPIFPGFLEQALNHKGSLEDINRRYVQHGQPTATGHVTAKDTYCKT